MRTLVPGHHFRGPSEGNLVQGTASEIGIVRRLGESSAPFCVSSTKVPLTCSSSQPIAKLHGRAGLTSKANAAAPHPPFSHWAATGERKWLNRENYPNVHLNNLQASLFVSHATLSRLLSRRRWLYLFCRRYSLRKRRTGKRAGFAACRPPRGGALGRGNALSRDLACQVSLGRKQGVFECHTHPTVLGEVGSILVGI